VVAVVVAVASFAVVVSSVVVGVVAASTAVVVVAAVAVAIIVVSLSSAGGMPSPVTSVGGHSVVVVRVLTAWEGVVRVTTAVVPVGILVPLSSSSSSITITVVPLSFSIATITRAEWCIAASAVGILVAVVGLALPTLPIILRAAITIGIGTVAR